MHFVLCLRTNRKKLKYLQRSFAPFKYLHRHPFLSRYINLYSPTNSGRTPTNNVVTTRRGTCRLPVHIPRFSHMIHSRETIQHARTNAPLVAYWLNFRVRAPYIVSARGSPTPRPALEPQRTSPLRAIPPFPEPKKPLSIGPRPFVYTSPFLQITPFNRFTPVSPYWTEDSESERRCGNFNAILFRNLLKCLKTKFRSCELLRMEFSFFLGENKIKYEI